MGNLEATIVAYSIIGSFLLTIPNRVIEVTWYSRERNDYCDKIARSETPVRPSLQSLVPTGWPTVMKNAANLVIALVFVDTIFGLPSILKNIGHWLE